MLPDLCTQSSNDNLKFHFIPIHQNKQNLNYPTNCFMNKNDLLCANGLLLRMDPNLRIELVDPDSERSVSDSLILFCWLFKCHYFVSLTDILAPCL